MASDSYKIFGLRKTMKATMIASFELLEYVEKNAIDDVNSSDQCCVMLSGKEKILAISYIIY